MQHEPCPVWMGHLLASPIRALAQNPATILAPYLREGMTALDIGCALGFFSLPMARLVGPSGLVICVDMQEGMLTRLERRAKRKGLHGRIQAHLCTQNSLRLEERAGSADFALAYAVVHEVPDPPALLGQIEAALKPGGLLLLGEPILHVPRRDFEESRTLALAAGFTPAGEPPIGRSHTVLLRKRPSAPSA